MKIRKLTIEDFDDVNELFLQVHNVHVEGRPDIYKKIAKPTTTRAWDYEASLADENVIVLGAEADGKIVGLCIVTLKKPQSRAMTPRTVATLDPIAVDKNYRKRGIGKALYQAATEHAKERGASSLELMVWSFNADAIAFYKSLGMTEQSFIMEQKI